MASLICLITCFIGVLITNISGAPIGINNAQLGEQPARPELPEIGGNLNLHEEPIDNVPVVIQELPKDISTTIPGQLRSRYKEAPPSKLAQPEDSLKELRKMKLRAGLHTGSGTTIANINSSTGAELNSSPKEDVGSVERVINVTISNKNDPQNHQNYGNKKSTLKNYNGVLCMKNCLKLIDNYLVDHEKDGIPDLTQNEAGYTVDLRCEHLNDFDRCISNCSTSRFFTILEEFSNVIPTILFIASSCQHNWHVNVENQLAINVTSKIIVNVVTNNTSYAITNKPELVPEQSEINEIKHERMFEDAEQRLLDGLGQSRKEHADNIPQSQLENNIDGNVKKVIDHEHKNPPNEFIENVHNNEISNDDPEPVDREHPPNKDPEFAADQHVLNNVPERNAENLEDSRPLFENNQIEQSGVREQNPEVEHLQDAEMIILPNNFVQISDLEHPVPVQPTDSNLAQLHDSDQETDRPYDFYFSHPKKVEMIATEKLANQWHDGEI